MKAKSRVVANLDLTFSAPKSVSVIWSQASPELRPRIEAAMVTAAHAVLAYMTQTKPIARMGRDEGGKRIYGPARGFAAAVALHAAARRAVDETVPWPQLHVHGLLVGVERPDGTFAGMESAGMFKDDAPLEGGAVGRSVLAHLLSEMGFEIECGTGPGGRFFEVRGVPSGLIKAMSGRSRDVDREVRRLEAARGKRMLSRERAVVAMKTRGRKGDALSAEEIAAAWDALAEEFDFVPTAVAALPSRPGTANEPEARRAAVRAAIERRIQKHRSKKPPKALRAIAFECSAGRLGLAETHALFEEMSSRFDAAPPGWVTAEAIQAVERQVTAD